MSDPLALSVVDPLVFSVVREDAYQELRRRVASHLGDGSQDYEARSALLRPPEIIRLLGQETVAVLGNDPLACGRFRALLAAATAFEIDPELESPAVSGQPPMVSAPTGGLIILEAVPILALAAIRVGVELGLAREFLLSLQALLLACGPAEAVHRLIALDPSDDELSAILDAFRERGSGLTRLRLALAHQLVLDPWERQRWVIIAQLFVALQRELDEQPWSAADGDGIAAVTYLGEAQYRLEGTFPPSDPGHDDQLPRVVVAARRTPRLHAERVTLRSWSAGAIDVDTGTPLSDGGWLGFCTLPLVTLSNLMRARLRAAWKDHGFPFLGRVPVEAIPAIDTVDVPPRIALAPPPRLVAVHVSQNGKPIGDGRALVVGSPLTVEVELDPPGVAWVTIADVRLPLAGDGRRAAGDVPGGVVVDGIILHVGTGVAAEGPPSDENTIGPLRIARWLSVVLVRPAVVDDDGLATALEEATAMELLAAAGRAAGVAVAVERLPWYDDSLATVCGLPGCADDGRVVALLEGLARQALVTSGLEHALWLALLPSPDLEPNLRMGRRESGWWRRTTAIAGRLAVCGPDGLRALIAAVTAEAWRVAPPATCLRLLGQQQMGGSVEWFDVRVEERARALPLPPPSAGDDLRFVLVPVSLTGADWPAEPLSFLDLRWPRTIAMLVPIGSEVTAVELRWHAAGHSVARTLARVDRIADGPRLSAVELADLELSWRYLHPLGLRARYALEAALPAPLVLGIDVAPPARAAAWALLERWRTCVYRRTLDPVGWQLQAGQQLRVVASDGWNAVSFPTVYRHAPTALPIAIRRTADGRWWADVPGDASVHWQIDAADRRLNRSGRTVEVEQAQRLRLTARRDGGELASVVLNLRDDHGYDRA